jgi:6-phosphogluconate dehydrogenase (decarboxylating)
LKPVPLRLQQRRIPALQDTQFFDEQRELLTRGNPKQILNVFRTVTRGTGEWTVVEALDEGVPLTRSALGRLRHRNKVRQQVADQLANRIAFATHHASQVVADHRIAEGRHRHQQRH